MLVIQIGRVERRKYDLVLVDSKKGEGRKKDFRFLNKKKIGKKKMIGEVDSRMTLPPQNLSDICPRDTNYMPIH